MKAARDSIAKLGNSLQDLKGSLKPQPPMRPVGRIYPAGLQPADPAKDALLQDLHAQYYEEGFDAVAWELSQVTVETPEEVLESIADRRTLVLEVVGELLSRQVLQNYSKFVQGIDDIAAIELDLQTAYGVAKSARRSLHTSREDIDCHIRIARDTSTKHACGEVVDIAQRLQQTWKLERQLRAAQEEHDFAQAFWLCGQSCAWMQSLHQLKVADRLTHHVTKLHKETADLLGSALQAVCADFKAETFSKVLEGYVMLSNMTGLGSEVHLAFSNALDANALRAIRVAVVEQPGAEERAKAASTLQDLAKLPSSEAFCACLQKVIAALFDVMLSHHRMEEWHNASIAGLTATLLRLAEAKAKLKHEVGTQASSDQPADQGQQQQGGSPIKAQGSGMLPSQKSVLKVLLHVTADASAQRSPQASSSMEAGGETRSSTADNLARIQELEAEEQEGGEWCEALRHVQSGLVQGRRLLVEDAARKVHVLLAAPAASHKDNVVKVITWVRLLAQASDTFCGVPDCGNLLDELGNLGFKHFRVLHSANLDSLFAALDRERWRQNVERAPGESMSSALPAADTQEQPQTFAQWAAAGNPWRRKGKQPEASANSASALLASDTNTSSEGSGRDRFVDGSPAALTESSSQRAEQAQIIRGGGAITACVRTAAASQIQRWMVEYANMLRVMEPAVVLVGGICELFEMYLVFVFCNFGGVSLSTLLGDPVATGADSEHLSERLKGTLARILNQSLQAYKAPLLARKTGLSNVRLTMFTPATIAARASPAQAALAVESSRLSDPGNLWGLQERLTAAQSLQSLAQEMRAAKKQLQRLLSPSQRQALEVFYTRTVEASGDVMDSVVRAGARLNFPIQELPESIAAHEYDLAEPPEASASWVDDMTSQTTLFKDRLAAIPQLDPDILHQLWCHGMRYAAEVLLSGLSQVKACSAIGRNAMSSDLQDLGYSLKAILPASAQVAAALESSLRLVDAYIKAFFLTSRDELQRWVQLHTEYSQPQVLLLAGAIAGFRGMKKKERAALVAQVQTWLA